jgi:hypothetical protein
MITIQKTNKKNYEAQSPTNSKMKWIHGKYINNNINMFRCILEGQWDKGSNVMKLMKWFFEVKNYDWK